MHGGVIKRVKMGKGGRIGGKKKRTVDVKEMREKKRMRSKEKGKR